MKIVENQCFKHILDFDDSNTKMKPWTSPAYYKYSKINRKGPTNEKNKIWQKNKKILVKSLSMARNKLRSSLKDAAGPPRTPPGAKMDSPVKFSRENPDL